MVWSIKICAKKCDIHNHNNNVGFEYDSNGARCKCLFLEVDLPNPLHLYLDPYKPTPNTLAGSGKTGVARIKRSVSTSVTCYKNLAYGGVTASAVNRDIQFIGLEGQVFKFDGRDAGWYANLASKNLQWDILFETIDSCPKN